MKTKSGIYVDVTERPGEIGLAIQYDAGTGDSRALTLFRVLLGLVDQRPPSEAFSGDPIVGPRPGWSATLKPLGAKRAAAGLKAISGILTTDEARTLCGLIRNAGRWADRPPMLTIIGLGCMPPGGIRHLLQRVADAANRGGTVGGLLPSDVQREVDAVLRPEEWVGDRCTIDRRSLEALRAAERVPCSVLAEADDRWDVRWARRSPLVTSCRSIWWRSERKCPDVWEPCKATDDGAVLVVLP